MAKNSILDQIESGARARLILALSLIVVVFLFTVGCSDRIL